MQGKRQRKADMGRHPLYDYEADNTAESGQVRQQRIARRKRQQRLKRNRRILLLVFLLLIAAAVLTLFLSQSDAQVLEGAWVYGEEATVQFNRTNRGVLTLADTNTEYTFSYTVQEDNVRIDFDNAYIASARYTFAVENDTLVLSGENGTTGGTYTLTRLSE